MFIVDDILLFPVRSLLFVLRGIHKAAREEIENEAESIRRELTDLYMMLETGRISEEEFQAQEQELLDRLEDAEFHGTEVEDDQPESLGTDEIEM
ncbi:gas vesicle protein GvpG [Candidatus Poribacteria bacterium]|nr:gas vesicle protein GvpG [Candidatus Poribacteria bacterium]